MQFQLKEPKCPSCGQLNNFQARDIEVKNYKYTLVSIQCGNCGAVVGIMPYEPIGSLVFKLAKHFNLA